jgi:hypothetical protein
MLAANNVRYAPRYRSLICYRYRCEFGWLRLFFSANLGTGNFTHAAGKTSQKRIEPGRPRLSAVIAKEGEIDGSRSDCRCMRQHPTTRRLSRLACFRARRWSWSRLGCSWSPRHGRRLSWTIRLTIASTWLWRSRMVADLSLPMNVSSTRFDGIRKPIS